MAKTKGLSSANRAWNIVQLSMLWARKGSLIKRKLVMDLHLASKYLKTLKRNSKDSIRYYGEHELSFDATPIIRVKMYKPTSMRFRIPCFTPVLGDDGMVDFDWDDDEDDCFGRKYALRDVTREEDIGLVDCEEKNDHGDEQIDERADKFIAEFYAQMRLQRQISRLDYQ